LCFQLGTTDAMGYVAKVDGALVGAVLQDVIVVSHHDEIVRTERADAVDTSHEAYFYLAGECAEHFSLRQIHALDGYTIDGLLGEYVGIEVDIDALRHHFNIIGMRQTSSTARESRKLT